MTIALIGFDYRTANLDIREKLALIQADLQMALLALCDSHERESFAHLDELIFLSTCNRMEIYFSAPAITEASQAVIEILGDLMACDVRPLLYQYEESQAVTHLMRVAAGLESMILGETQILGQVAQALEIAQANQTVGAVLSHLFSQALHAGKRARHETQISRHSTSVSNASVLFLLEKLSIQPETARVLLIGAGEMARLAGQALRQSGIGEVAILNRSPERAKRLAKDIDAQIFAWDEIPQALQWADAVIAAVTTPHPIISAAQVSSIQAQAQHPLVLVDIGVPRNIEASVQSLDQVQYFDIDAIQSLVDTHLALRKAAIPQVEKILAEELARFSLWYQGRQVAPTIIQLREWAQAIAQEELAEALTRLGSNDERTQEIVSLLAHRLVNRLLHEPTTRLRLQAVEGNGDDYAQAVRTLFALEETHDLPITG